MTLQRVPRDRHADFDAPLGAAPHNTVTYWVLTARQWLICNMPRIPPERPQRPHRQRERYYFAEDAPESRILELEDAVRVLLPRRPQQSPKGAHCPLQAVWDQP